MRFPATPGWGPPVVVGVPRHSWMRAPGAGPRHSWQGSAGGGGVWLPATPGWGLPVAVGYSLVVVPLVVCVCGVFGCGRWPCCVVCCVFVVSALLVVWCGSAEGGSSACAGVRGCVCVVCRWSVLCCPRLFWFGLGAGVSVGVVGVWCGPPATRG